MKRKLGRAAGIGAAAAAMIWAGAMAPGTPQVDSVSRTEPEMAASAAVESYADRWTVVPMAKQLPVLDGDLEPLWAESASRLNGFVTMYDNKPAQAETDVYLLHDRGHLFIAMEGRYGPEGKPAGTEIVEVLIAPDSGGNEAYRLKIDISEGDRPISVNWGGTIKNLDEAEVKKVAGKERWTAEAKIPLRSLGAPENESAWKLNVLRYYGINSDPFNSWTPIRHSYITDTGGRGFNIVAHILNQNRMGRIYLDQPPAPGGSAAAAAEPWYPERWELSYTGFESKRLTLSGVYLGADGQEMELAWISPSGTRSKLEITDIAGKLSGTEIAFLHPKPLEKGQYRLEIRLREQAAGAGQEANSGGVKERYAEISFDRDALVRAGETAFASLRKSVTKREVQPAPASASVQKLLELIPENTGFIFTGLPENPGLRPYQLYNWSPANPNQIVSKTTGTVYPNDKYKESKKITVQNRKGETVEYPYYEDEEGRRYFLTAHVWYFQKDYAVRETAKIAASDPLGAARLLNRWADVYAGYLPTNDYYWTNYPVVSGPPYHYWGGVWYRWYTGEMTNLSYLINAYRDVRATNAFELLSEELGFDVEKKIVETLFQPSFEFVRSFPVLNHNMEYTYWLGLARMGKASGDPSYIHEAVELVSDFAANNFLSDGFWKEVTLSYHNQSTNGLTASLNELKGWTDPENYISPRSGMRLEQLDMMQQYPALANSQNMKNIVAYPNGSYLPIQDTWANERTAQPRTDLGSYLLTGSGISRLTLGKGAAQQQVWLTFTPKYGHNHYDPLNLTLFDEGQELLSDIGYTHSLYRTWSTSTLAHNTVVVDGKDMSASGDAQHGGKPEALIQVGEDVQIVKASQTNAYPATKEYSREPWLIRFGDSPDAAAGYVVDLFRVSGGNRHEYTLNGDANRDGRFTANVPLEPYAERLLPPGTAVKLPELETQLGSAEGHYHGYIYIENVQRAEVPEGQYQVTLVTEENGTEKAKLRVIGFAGPGENELFIGQSPSMRSTRLNGTNGDINTEAVKYYMPKMVLRRSGTDLDSTFVHVMEAYSGTNSPKIESAELLKLEQADKGDIILKISYGTVTDYVLSSANGVTPLRAGDIELIGRHGFIRTVNGEVVKMMLADGTLLRMGDQTVTGEGAVTGTVTEVLRKAAGDPVNALVTEAQVPAKLAGQTVIVTHPDGKADGYPIQDIRREGNRTLLVLNGTEPGWTFLEDGSSRMTAFPGLSWQGEHRFRIGNLEVWQR